MVINVEINRKLTGIRIMQRRKALGLTQEELAEKIGLSKNHISNMECGKYLPTTKVIVEICNILGETPDYYLLGRISETTDRISALLKSLPIDSQKIVYRLIETYLDEISSKT